MSRIGKSKLRLAASISGQQLLNIFVRARQQASPVPAGRTEKAAEAFLSG
jgi:hypothetical protein